jgi:transposase
MNIDENNLPDDPALLKELARAMLASLREADRKIEQLTHQLNVLRRSQFGRKSERVADGQLVMPFAAGPDPIPPAAAPPAADDAPAPARQEKKKNGHGRKPLPPHLPREEVKHEVPDSERRCKECSGELAAIGEEASEQLDYVPASFIVRRHVRVKYACKACQGNVVLAEMPQQPIEKGLPGAGLLAQVTVGKYADHLPLNRQSEIYARAGVELSRSTLCDWIAFVADLLLPIVRLMEREILCSRKIHTDDIPVPVLDILRDRTRLGRLWPYLGDRDHPYIVFRYTPTRSRDGPMEFLAGFCGYLQADAFSGYDELYRLLKIIEVACWAHVRRYFFDAKESDATNAHVAIAYIRQLYDVEDAARDLSDPQRHGLRQERSKPILDEFKAWLDRQRIALLPKSPIGQAVHYTLQQWEALNRYLEDGILDIDNNAAERALRCVAVGRKNWMFAGSDRGGERAAVLYSIMVTCKEHGVDPLAYLTDVLERVSTTPESRIGDLLPDRWKQRRAEQSAARAGE